MSGAAGPGEGHDGHDGGEGAEGTDSTDDTHSTDSTGRADPADHDALWRSIVANYGDRATLDDEPEETHGPAAATGDPAGERSVPRTDPSPALDPWVERHLAEEHFTPPEPVAAPLPEPRRLLAWSGVMGVPAVLLLLVVLGVGVPSWGSLLMLAWFLGGFGYLVATMRSEDDDDGDDGAVV